jgi:hypothetical protein
MTNDLISRSALLKSLQDSYKQLSELYLKETDVEQKLSMESQLIVFTEVILRTKKAPAVDAKPVQNGKWSKPIIIGYDGIHVLYGRSCSECGYDSRLYHANYCPHCGAKMMISEEERCTNHQS